MWADEHLYDQNWGKGYGIIPRYEDWEKIRSKEALDVFVVVRIGSRRGRRPDHVSNSSGRWRLRLLWIHIQDSTEKRYRGVR